MKKQWFAWLAVGIVFLAYSSVWAQTNYVLDTGDPNERVCNPRSYTDLGNGIVRDNTTGFEWQQATAAGGYYLGEAIDYCAGLTLGGFSDWRLPSIEELCTLVDAGRHDPPAINTAYFSDTAVGAYWSSTTFVLDPVGSAWYVTFDNGYAFPIPGGKYRLYVRAVRGGPLQINNFVDNGDGTIDDTATGLMWQQATATAYTWDSATAYCENLYLGGYDDWRLPTRNELLSLVDNSRTYPWTTFPNTVASSYWSSTTYASNTDYAWYMGFNSTGGGWKRSLKSSNIRVQAVRGGPCRADGDWCIDNNDCAAGQVCVDGECQTGIEDDPPALGDGPFVAAGAWPVLSASAESPTFFNQNYSVLWTFSDDFGSCSGACTHAVEYQIVGDSAWTALTVSSDAAEGYAYVGLPITELQNATTYAFRFSVTDCAGQTMQSGEYYFRVATSDAPPVITGGPWLAAGSWPALPTSASRAVLLTQDRTVLWTFDDDYASCSGLCTHRARYKKVEAVDWTWIPVGTDPDGDWYAYTTLPVESLENGTYQFYFDVRDCAGQRTSAPKVYYFKVE